MCVHKRQLLRVLSIVVVMVVVGSAGRDEGGSQLFPFPLDERRGGMPPPSISQSIDR